MVMPIGPKIWFEDMVIKTSYNMTYIDDSFTGLRHVCYDSISQYQQYEIVAACRSGV